jgi:hypothetical protein
MKEIIYALEVSLLESSTRQSVKYLNKVISDDFVEFGSSGQIYHKQDLLDSLPLEAPFKSKIDNFEVTELSNDVILATYRATRDSIVSLRSSIWQHKDGEWFLIFHQGTKQTIEK